MTVKELIESNACIVEIYITIRGDYVKSLTNGKREFQDSIYVHKFAIGKYAFMGKDAQIAYRGFGKGERGSKFKEPYTIINKELNSRANREYWSVKTNVIPKAVLDLEVSQWYAKNAYSWLHNQTQRVGYESAQEINITVKLPPEQIREIRIESEVKKTEEIDGQINLLEMLN